ncbi:hypothetical protein [Leptospira kmetyi]|uniref:Uncharacterized protein n=1 Tax=Leptospira kmetyi TaxID=408139 RepID=A0ABX4NA97_9LEPT|nr:hypothetical protein [Leptospira kmetyi]PJZ29084.1 hypothetical protein CH378_14455 [Leptospira kmetyi]PJZ39749.1 hypothetical protein CH370_20060 [Leptospira kmetyi]
MPAFQSTDEVLSISKRTDISVPPKRLALEIRLPGSSKNLFFPVEYVSNIRSHRSLTSGRGGISLTIPYQEEYLVQVGESDPQPLSQIKDGESLRFKDIFRVRSIVFLFYDNSSTGSKEVRFKKLNAGKVKSASREYSPDGKSFVSVNISSIETILSETDFFIDFQRGEGEPQTRTGESYAGVITSAAKVFLQGQLSDLLKNFWDEFFCKLLNVSRYAEKRILSTTSLNDPDALLTFLPPKKAYTEHFVYEAQVLSSFSIGQYVSFWEILRSYLCEPLYELFVDPLESFDINDHFGNGVAFGEIGSSQIEEYTVGKYESKVIFRPTPFYFLSKDGKYRDLRASSIDAGYIFSLDDLKNFKVDENESSVVSGVHVIQNTFQAFGTVLSEPKYEDKIRSIFGPKLLHIKIPGLVFKEENLSQGKKENYKGELSRIRDMIFSIFCDLSELKISDGYFDLPFIPIRIGMPFQIQATPRKEYPFPSDEISTFGYITDVVDSFSENLMKSDSQVSFKWGPSGSSYE